MNNPVQAVPSQVVELSADLPKGTCRAKTRDICRLLTSAAGLDRRVTPKGLGRLAKKTIGILIISVLSLSPVIWTACDFSKSTTPSTQSVVRLTVGTAANDLSSLIWIAKVRGYFSEQQLDIDFKIYESGHLAIGDLLAGKLDLATATEFAAVRHGLERTDFRIISILDQTRDQQIVARKDHGINHQSDLKNKRVGVALNTSSEYYLHLLLVLQGIRPEDVRIVDLLPSEQVAAIARGEIDAAIVWEPFASMMKKELGKNAVSWQGQSGQDEYWLLLGTLGAIEKQSSAIPRFLKALASAEDFIKNNETAAMGIVEKQLESRHLGSLWMNHRFRLGLHRPLILKMEAELRWLRSGLHAPKPDILDLLDFIYVDALKSVEPNKINML
ncbi:MAG: NrtA/SsuA/CpmA family ABC transporter substrate-binding protein [Desulfomonile tiedjei]|uniref:NrtA/SsuA/CpmA family ABC transporter substrate-binding protein n=1 Tax=Desulfomonile tiedjei TaxID=2358 RepID=A0A9D6V681_9BACT|nr:NrtA/SsuA/CpmA family ABC transporter substrate-binding protein [Desulfomonile tiedjei]